jgi:hypothetical protein
MATVLEVYATEEQSPVLQFYGQKDSIQRIFIKRRFLLTLECVCLSLSAVHNKVETFSQGHSKVAGDETEVRKWLRQQSQHFYAASLDALVKR